jgi:hypothetical protein
MDSREPNKPLYSICSDATGRSLRHAVIALATTAAMACFTSALAQANASDEEQSAPDEEPGRQVAIGILPQLGVALRLPEDFRLYKGCFSGRRRPQRPLRCSARQHRQICGNSGLGHWVHQRNGDPVRMEQEREERALRPVRRSPVLNDSVRYCLVLQLFS